MVNAAHVGCRYRRYFQPVQSSAIYIRLHAGALMNTAFSRDMSRAFSALPTSLCIIVINQRVLKLHVHIIVYRSDPPRVQIF
jgi:hypothetical protein